MDEGYRQYDLIQNLWADQLGENEERRDEYYQHSLNYWTKVPSTVDGMLGGFATISNVDASGSIAFLNEILRLPRSLGGSCGWSRALDCGSGIGRVTKDCLLHVFEEVELLEPVLQHLQKSREFIKSDRVTKYHNASLQNFSPEKIHFDCIWLQWCTGFLTDNDFVAFLRRCRNSLKLHGVVCVKDNVSLNDLFIIDNADRCVTRCHEHYKRLFDCAEYDLVFSRRELNLPQMLQPVYMYCLRPKKRTQP